MNKDITQDAMSDNEIRVLGGGGPFEEDTNPARRHKLFRNFDKKKMVIFALIVLIFIILVVLVCLVFSQRATTSSQPVADSIDSVVVYSEKNVVETKTVEPGLAIQDTIINDIPLQIFTPRGCQLSLHLGKVPQDTNIMLLVQAADIRRDKDLPVGAFVYNGELISKGHSKYGFCAIIGDDITLGRQLETVLLERAIENNGSFFRQYSLVSEGQLISIPPKGKSQRKALCYRQGELQVVITQDEESFHDFSQALVDLGVEEAISLVGGASLMQYKNADGETVQQGKFGKKRHRSENFLIWREVPEKNK